MASEDKKKMTDAEQKVLDAIAKGNVEEVKLLLQNNDIKIDFLDDSGMTPLQHAAFRGRDELCQLFLAHGADVNSDKHENGYSALMFAALSGNPVVTHAMLRAGAKVNHVNSVGRTASQMAAFVGQHQCVSVINNFLPEEVLIYFTKIQGLETEPRLPKELVPALNKITNTPNLHPVKILMYLQDHVGILESSTKVVNVLEHLCTASMKEKDTNDIRAMKMHYLATLIRHAGFIYKEKNSLDYIIKMFVTGRESDGFPEFQEKFIRQVLREFPYSESELLQQMVRSLAKVTIGDDPTGLYMLTQGINGQKFVDDETRCGTCGELRAEKKCSFCKMVNYCNQRCQKLHWATHKKFCKQLAETYAKNEKRRKLEEEKQKQADEKKELEKKMKQTSIANDKETIPKESESKAAPAEDAKSNSQTCTVNRTTENAVSS